MNLPRSWCCSVREKKCARQRMGEEVEDAAPSADTRASTSGNRATESRQCWWYVLFVHLSWQDVP